MTNHMTPTEPIKSIGGSMREIKFRAWLTLSDYDDEGNAKDYFTMASKISVHHDGSIGFSLEEANSMFTEDVVQRALNNGNIWEYEEWCYWESAFELMQYTGLKDKNGVEIYEGDIVEDSSSRYKIIYHTDGFYLHNIYEPENILLQLRHCYLLNTVIGNIYENPELLEEV